MKIYRVSGAEELQYCATSSEAIRWAKSIARSYIPGGEIRFLIESLEIKPRQSSILKMLNKRRDFAESEKHYNSFALASGTGTLVGERKTQD